MSVTRTPLRVGQHGDSCGRALCGHVLNSSSNDKGEAVLINMKPKTASRWTRINGSTERLITARQISPAPRS